MTAILKQRQGWVIPRLRSHCGACYRDTSAGLLLHAFARWRVACVRLEDHNSRLLYFQV
jgi:hypothetical protein